MKKRVKMVRVDRLQNARAVNNLTQDELAVRIGIDQSQYARYERADGNDPSNEMLVRIAHALNVTTDYLLGQSDDPVPSMTEDDLSTDELALLNAYRTGRMDDLLQLILDARRSQHTDVEPATSAKKS